MVVACGSQEIKIEPPELELADFTSDGCSLFIDGTFENPELWKVFVCCTTWPTGSGGTEERESRPTWRSRRASKKTEDPVANLMYEAVRAGGAYFPTWYRWGYGWPIGRGYKALTRRRETG